MQRWRMTACAKLAVLCGLALASGIGAAAAQQPTQAQANAIRQSCRSDYQAHCASVPTGGSAALQCLQSNMASLSQGCHTAVAAVGGGGMAGAAPPAGAAAPGGAMPQGAMRGRMMGLRQACGGDFRSVCPGVMPGGGRALQCLADHQESLSEPCRAALAEARGAR